MHFSNVLFAAASFASVAVAQTSTAVPDSGAKVGPNSITDFGINVLNVQAGMKYTVHWTNPKGDVVSINIRSGNPDNLSKPITLCADVDNNGSCTFTIPDDVPSGTQNTLEICQGSDTASCNYSPMFTVGGGTGSAVTGSDGTATATATGDSTETETGKATATGAETITGTSTKKQTTLATEASASSTDAESTPTETETEAEATSSQTGAAPAPNEGSVARSSSLAMALCVMAAVVYLN